MPKVTLPEEEFARRNRDYLTRILRPLLPASPHGQIGSDRQSQANGFIIAAYHGPRPQSYRDWRFPTFVSGFRANYFEHWKPRDPNTPAEWYLDKAYLHIYRQEADYIALHADPEEVDTADGRARYKRGPHIHIKIKPDDPISRSHIALAHKYIDNTLASNRDFFEAMREGIELISDEVLSRFMPSRS
jgi:hypothetical protein